MNAQQEAVALYRYLESRGFKPSVRMVGRIMREEMNLRFTEFSLRKWLKVASEIEAAEDSSPVATTWYVQSEIKAADDSPIATTWFGQ